MRATVAEGSINEWFLGKSMLAMVARARGIAIERFAEDWEGVFRSHTFAKHWLSQIYPKVSTPIDKQKRCIFTEITLDWFDEILSSLIVPTVDPPSSSQEPSWEI